MVICGTAIIIRLPLFMFPFINIDENEYRLAAQIILNGGLPYRDFLIYQPPVIYYFFAGIAWLFGTNALWPVHLVMLFVMVMSSLLLCSIGRLLWSEQAGLWAAAGYGVCAVVPLPSDMLGANMEVLLTIPVLMAVRLVLSPSAMQSAWYAVGGGVLLGLAICTKYPAGLLLIPVGWSLWLNRSPAQRWHHLLGLVAGCGTLIGGVLLALQIAGVWPEAFATFRYILQYAKGPVQSDPLYVGLKFVVRTLLVACGGALFWWSAARGSWALLCGEREARTMRRPSQQAHGFLLLWAAVGAVLVVLGGRIYFHYYFFLFPPVVLLGGLWLAGRWGTGWAAWSARIRWSAGCWSIACVLGILGHCLFRIDEGSLTATEWRPVAQRLAAMTQPGETLFVWGYCPQLYTISALLPATRFTTADYLTGRTPKTAGLEYDPTIPSPPSSLEKVLNDFRTPTFVTSEKTDHNIFPGAWVLLEKDFARRLPDYIVDTAPADYRRYGRYPIEAYPFLAGELAAHYRAIEQINGFIIYRRTKATETAVSRTRHSPDL
ncbi:MAG: glycosyltransferase family 39 protein [Deltaproteobacteria bacterium]|nr:glycosyltransferase family 39 protein [Deltaproteobacteria bacterium]